MKFLIANLVGHVARGVAAIGLVLAGVVIGWADDAAKQRFNFETDIVPILNKFGCNTSGCHGKAEGQNGFKLSVFGSDPEADFRALVMEGRGRRVFPAAPERSLLLLKASGGLPHGGGVRLDVDKPEFATVRDWIAAGLPLGSADDPKVVSIAVFPKEQALAAKQSISLRVTAKWSDGRETDVTRMAQFQTNNDAVARVDDKGQITAGDNPGSVAVMANYLGNVDLFQAIIPRPEKVKDYPTFSEHNFVDRLVYARLRKLNIVPAPMASDAEFLRRVSLDLIGTLPTSDEARKFLADTRPNRRELLVNEMFSRPEFADYWALRWADLLRVDREVLGPKAAYEMYHWIRESVAQHKPLDIFARQIITAEGQLSEVPQGNIFKVVTQPGEQASTISQVFLGVRIACAQCHHHPYDRWTQTDYFGMQAYFAQLQRKPSPLGEVLLAEGKQVTKHPRTGEMVHPHALGTTMPAESSEADRRPELATWLTSPQNPWFARNISNRVWAYLMGRGLVEPVDDFRATNPPSNPELLDALAAHLADHKFDLRELLRVITSSNVYQQATTPNPTNADDEQNFARASLKRMDAEVLLDAVCQVTGVPEKFEGIAGGARAIQLWDSRVDHYFLSLYGRPLRKSACECERNAEPSVAQVLHLLNSDRVQTKLTHDAGTIARLMRTMPDNAKLVDELYLSIFSRFPTDDEKRVAINHFSATSNRRQAAEDLAWSMLNSLEFVFNH